MKRAALCVGVNRYQDPGINGLQFAEADATELYAFFKRSAGYEDVRHLVAPEPDQILDCAREMAAGLRAGDLFVFFFAGHGYEFQGRHLLLCPKTRLSRLQFFHQTVPVDLLKEETQLHGADRVFVLDVCRTDLLKGRGGPNGLLGAQGLRDIVTTASAGEGGAFTLLCACDEGQQARELPDLGQGLFSRALIEELEAAVQAGAEFKLDDRCESDLRGRMTRLASQFGIPADQRPWIERSGRVPLLLGGRMQTVTESGPDEPPSGFATQDAGRVLCPICGLQNEPDETFRCRSCGRDYLCRSHFVESQLCCQECEQKTQKPAKADSQTQGEQDSQAESYEHREEGARVEAPEKHRVSLDFKQALGSAVGITKAAFGTAVDVTKETARAYAAFLWRLAKWSAIAAVILLPLPIVGSVFHWSWMNGSYLLVLALICITLLMAASPLIMLAQLGYDHIRPYRRVAQLMAGVAFWALLIVMYFWLVPVWNYPAAIPVVLIICVFLAVAFVSFGIGLNPRVAVGVVIGLLTLMTVCFYMPASRSAAGMFVAWLDARVAGLFTNPRRIEYDLSSIDQIVFFDLSNGKANVWYYAGQDGRIELFDGQGYHPQFNAKLEPITPDIVTRIRTQLRADAQELAQKEPRTEESERREGGRTMELDDTRPDASPRGSPPVYKPPVIAPEDANGRVDGRPVQQPLRRRDTTIEPEQTDGKVVGPKNR